MHERDAKALLEDLIRHFRVTQSSQLSTYLGMKDSEKALSIYAILLPAEMNFRHAHIVRGASRLKDLGSLLPGATHLQKCGDRDSGWRDGSMRLNEWLSSQNTTRNSVPISMIVRAVDRPSAGRRGRRALVELLDQYMAGHRAAQLFLDAEGFTGLDGGANPSKDDALGTPVRTAYPLVPSWPLGLRETLRMTHLSRTADSPLAATALAWSAVESTGLKARERPSLAKVLALQALRQQVSESYTRLDHELRVHSAYWANAVNLETRFIDDLSSALTKIPAGHTQRGTMKMKLDSRIARRVKLQTRLSSLEASLQALDASGLSNSTVGIGRLLDLNDWADALRFEGVAGSVIENVSPLDLDFVSAAVSPFSRRQVHRWQLLLADSSALLEWLAIMEGRFRTLLTSMYSSRNMTVHTGSFRASGDIVLGIGAAMVADMMLEFFGNWYRQASGPMSQLTPVEIIESLASRKDCIDEKLRSATATACLLNVGWITSPSTQDAWDRGA